MQGERADARRPTRGATPPPQALSHNMTSTAQLQLRINELMGELSEAQTERDATLQQTLQQVDVMGALRAKCDLVKAELAAAQVLNSQLHEQLTETRGEQVRPLHPGRACTARARPPCAAFRLGWTLLYTGQLAASS